MRGFSALIITTPVAKGSVYDGVAPILFVPPFDLAGFRRNHVNGRAPPRAASSAALRAPLGSKPCVAKIAIFFPEISAICVSSSASAFCRLKRTRQRAVPAAEEVLLAARGVRGKQVRNFLYLAAVAKPDENGRIGAGRIRAALGGTESEANNIT
jgi:hypothetical protein